MRKTYDFQMSIHPIPIEDLPLHPTDRDIVQVYLYGLQKIFVDPQTRTKWMALLETYQPGVNKRRGRPGMEVWQILVLAGLNTLQR